MGNNGYVQMVSLTGQKGENDGLTFLQLQAADTQAAANALNEQALATEETARIRFEAAVDLIKGKFKSHISDGHCYHRKHFSGSIETATLTSEAIEDFKTKFETDKIAQGIICALAKTLQTNESLQFTQKVAKANQHQHFFTQNTRFNPNMAVLILLNEFPEGERPAQSNLASLARIAFQSITWNENKAEDAQTKAQLGQNIVRGTAFAAILFVAWVASRDAGGFSLGETADGYLFVSALCLMVGSFVFGSAMRDKALESISVDENTNQAVGKPSLIDYATPAQQQNLAAAIEPLHDEIQGRAPMWVGI